MTQSKALQEIQLMKVNIMSTITSITLLGYDKETEQDITITVTITKVDWGSFPYEVDTLYEWADGGTDGLLVQATKTLIEAEKELSDAVKSLKAFYNVK